MVGRALEQLFFDTNWPELDYLVIDLPPGTGDVALTLVQKVPVTGVIMVTTPQKVALLDVRKALTMFAKVNVPVMGIVENMAAHACPSCGHSSEIFGSKGGEALAEQYDVPLLGRLTLDPLMCESSETGIPWMQHEEYEYCQHMNTAAFYQIANKVSAQLSLTKIDYSGRLPGVVVEK
jgi:ATP-binding protein involved in chromosome partitioning